MANSVIIPPPEEESSQKNGLLVRFEIDNFPAEYREYYEIKRNNLFASIQGFGEVWNLYMGLDHIFMREFSDLKTACDLDRIFPLLLYFNAHAKIRVAMELAFTGCLAEARSILRDAIEFVGHAHTMLSDVELQKTWLSKNDGKAALDEFKQAFEKQKKEGIFKGLNELHKTWGDLSETGSHATINAMCDRFAQVDSADHIEFRLSYCGAEHRHWALSIFSMLLTCFTMEQTLFSDYESRLKLDAELMKLKSEFERQKEQLREKMKVKYKVEPPSPIEVPKPLIFRP